MSFLFFFFNDTATTEIYTLSLHDALPISWPRIFFPPFGPYSRMGSVRCWSPRDRKSTRLNSSHLVISYAVFCLKKKKKQRTSISLQKKIVSVILLNYMFFFLFFFLMFPLLLFFFFNDTATTEIYTLSLHDALPIWRCWSP